MIIYVSSSSAGGATDPCWAEVLSLMNFESGLLVDSATARSNTWTQNGSFNQDAAAALSGSYGGRFDSAGNANIVTTGANFRADTSKPWCFEFFIKPISSPLSSGGTSSLRNAVATLSTTSSITSMSSVVEFFWWHSGSGGTFGFANSGLTATGISSGTKHHIALQYDGVSVTQPYVNGTRLGISIPNLGNFNTIFLGNMATIAQSYLDGSWSDYITRADIDDARFTYDCVRYSGASFTPPTGPFATS